MGKSINKAFVLGRLGADPETRYTPSGTAVTNLRIATSEQWKDKQTGEKREKTEWHRVVLFGRLAEVAGEYLKKGSEAWVEGRIETDKWDDKEGVTRYTTKIIGSDLGMIGGKPNGGQSSGREREPGSDDDMGDGPPF